MKRDVVRAGERAQANQDAEPGDINFGAGCNTNNYSFFYCFLSHELISAELLSILWPLIGFNVNTFWNKNLFKNYSTNDFSYSVGRFHVIMRIF
jgi:hypothetical protein